jgi:hypothetical protein
MKALSIGRQKWHMDMTTVLMNAGLFAPPYCEPGFAVHTIESRVIYSGLRRTHRGDSQSGAAPM